MKNIPAQEAHRLVEDEGAVLIDVRERDEWDEMRVPGAMLHPLSKYEGDPSQVPAADKTIFICTQGNRSQAAAAIYEEANPGSEAFNLEGGLASWAGYGLPFEIGPPSTA